jgi:hypothetical protein
MFSSVRHLIIQQLSGHRYKITSEEGEMNFLSIEELLFHYKHVLKIPHSNTAGDLIDIFKRWREEPDQIDSKLKELWGMVETDLADTQ